ncbi:MAG: Gfo/Idh/MocA family oxidoreductase [Oscillospiraceae bacterium]|nr:Gfo/Idh/MocA family oxidoreductase [Oscillospiraceae bacterium]
MDRIKVGVIGVGRGMSFARSAAFAGMELVALCDSWEGKLREAGRDLGVATYADYGEFLGHDMDAVILANYFNEHAPFAIKALRAGKHVMSETSSNSTLAEGVALCRAVEESGKVYMLAENYAYTAFSQEMRRLYAAGEIGKATYAEGEYNHPVDPDYQARLTDGDGHWRMWLPPTYYCTHALAPLMYVTDAMPRRVTSFSIPREAVSRKYADPGCAILIRMDDGSVFRIFGLMLPGHSNWYRIHGERGAVELTRGPGYFGPGQLRVWHDHWTLREGEEAERVYTPEFPEFAEQAKAAGHGGGDFFTNHHFAQAIREGRQPYLDVYRGVAMSSVGILAWKSALGDGEPFDVPDFGREDSRAAYQDDHWSPFPKDAGPGQPPSSVLGFVGLSDGVRAFYERKWAEMREANERNAGG